ncbi:hypothetical protein D6833_13720 [Candidatus Parcubacteria bacterium]|nr:MAG: hypothetical protein D6833_13720 [Candidatus Parcubacteria bacterium]
MEKFAIPKSFRTLYVGSSTFLVLLGAASFAWLVYLHSVEEQPDLSYDLIVGFFAIAAFSLGIYGLRQLPRLRSWIEIDDSGISYCLPGRARQTLRWSEVEEVRERLLLQRLELRSGQTTIPIEYQVEDFDKLREIVLNNTEIIQPIVLPLTLSKSRFYTLWYVSVILGMLALCFYMVRLKQYLLAIGLALPAYAVIKEYLVGIKSITLTDRAIILHFPFRSEMLQLDDVLRVSVQDAAVQSMRHPAVILDLRNGGFRKIRALGMDAIKLCSLLNTLKGSTPTVH